MPHQLQAVEDENETSEDHLSEVLEICFLSNDAEENGGEVEAI